LFLGRTKPKTTQIVSVCDGINGSPSLILWPAQSNAEVHRLQGGRIAAPAAAVGFLERERLLDPQSARAGYARPTWIATTASTIARIRSPLKKQEQNDVAGRGSFSKIATKYGPGVSSYDVIRR
jgi:hypothetical protein